MGAQSGWQLSGQAPEAYERYLVPAWMVAWAQDLVSAAHLHEGERVLDVACGTGVVTRLVAPAVGATGTVTGCDVNTAMLRLARQLAGDGATGAIAWRQGDVAALPFAEGVYDVVLCQQGLQYFPDRPAALREMARVLRPGGRLVLSVWRSLERQPFHTACIAAVASQTSPETAFPLQAAFALGAADVLRGLVTAAGFRDVHVRIEVKMARHPACEDLVQGFLAASPLANVVAALPETTRAAIVRAARQALIAYCDDGGLAVPMECHVVVAHT